MKTSELISKVISTRMLNELTVNKDKVKVDD